MANHVSYNIASVNMSLTDGGNYNSAGSQFGIGDELAALAAANVIVVSASGNDFYTEGSVQGVGYPASDPNSLSIGAVFDTNFGQVNYGTEGSLGTAFSTGADRIAVFSQRHETLTTAFAPGAPITGANKSGGTVTMYGTSQASPHIAGLAVLAQQLAVQEMGRRLTSAEYEQILRDTGLTINDGDNEDDNVTNTGLDFPRVNVLAVGEAIRAMAGATLPYDEHFDDGSANFFVPQLGNWIVTSSKKYHVEPGAGENGITLLNMIDTLTDAFHMDTVLKGKNTGVEHNAAMIFDYQGAIDFKFIAADYDANQWQIGHFDGSDWNVDASLNETLATNVDYAAELQIVGSTATLAVDGVEKLSFDFGGTINDGQLGLGTRNAITVFDDVAIFSITTLPHTDDFSDHQADFFEPQAGAWYVTNGERYRGEANGNAAISLLPIAEPLPQNLQIQSIIRGKNNGAASNGMVLFDYHGANDFKFAGGNFDLGEWQIGHFDGSTWFVDASFAEAITSNVDYSVEVLIENATATLSVGTTEKATFNFAAQLNNGQIGLGSHDSHTIFDNLTVKEAGISATGASLPHTEKFDDGVANFFSVVAGTWMVSVNDRYEAASGSDAISLIAVDGALPGDTHLSSVIRAKGTGPSYNGYILFDYQGATDFKFAGVDADAGAWVLGHRDGTGWQVDASVAGPVSDKVDYAVDVYLSGTGATLFANNQFKATFDYGEALTSGEVGLGSSNAVTIFDDFSLAEGAAPAPGTTLPHTDDFSDGEADFFSPQLGTWHINEWNRYRGEAAAGGDAISLLQTAATLPANYQFDAVMRSKNSGAKQNMYMVFDYQGPTDFKYAGAAVGSGKWKIGHCDGSGWPVDATFSETITSNVDYNASLQIEGATATLLIGGVEKVSFDFGASLNSGQAGFGVRDGHAIFDDLAADALTTGASLPHTEDFDDGVANFFSVVSGTWMVSVNDRYEAASGGSDAISLIAVAGALPGDTHISSVIRAKANRPVVQRLHTVRLPGGRGLQVRRRGRGRGCVGAGPPRRHRLAGRRLGGGIGLGLGGLRGGRVPVGHRGNAVCQQPVQGHLRLRRGADLGRGRPGFEQCGDDLR